MNYTFDEQCRYFNDTNRFSVEVLSKEAPDRNPHLELVRQFVNKKNPGLSAYISSELIQTSQGNIERYWQAYDENKSDDVRIYLVIDNCVPVIRGMFTRQIAFYFGICNGNVFDPPPKTKTPHEDKIVRLLVKNYAFYSEKEKRILEPIRLSVGDTVFEKLYNISSREELNEFPDDLKTICKELVTKRIANEEERKRQRERIFEVIEKVYDEQDIQRIESIADYYIHAYRDRKITTKEDNNTSRLVSKTYPAIMLTHFVKNDAYSSSVLKFDTNKFSYKLGDFVFWEIIWKKLKEIQKLSGLSYVYLLAAEGFIGGNPIEEDAKDKVVIESKLEKTFPDKVLKLLAYYRRHFNFQFLNKVIDKQAYDFSCFSMLQTMENMEEYKKLIWDSNSDM